MEPSPAFARQPSGWPETERGTLSVPEAARVLGISRTHAYVMTKRGEIPTLRFGRSVRVSKIALERLLTGEREEAGRTG